MQKSTDETDSIEILSSYTEQATTTCLSVTSPEPAYHPETQPTQGHAQEEEPVSKRQRNINRVIIAIAVIMLGTCALLVGVTMNMPYNVGNSVCTQKLHLKERFPKESYDNYNKRAYRTIRRSHKFRCGIFYDQTIEQYLVRLMPISGGMTGGHGMSESTITIWLYQIAYQCAMPLKDLRGDHATSSEQHKNLNKEKIARDMRDIAKCVVWFTTHPPFLAREGGMLVSITAGNVAGSDLNCDHISGIGGQLVKNVAGQNFTDLKLHRNDRVKTLATANKLVNVRDEVVDVNLDVLISRTCGVLDGST